MYCVRSSQELASLTDGELSPAQAAELQRHVADCAVCRRELSRHKQTASLVGTLTEVAPPQDLRARIQRKAAQPRPAAALTCSSTREMLDGYAHGELAPEAADKVCAHLCECVECTLELDQIEETVGLLGLLPEMAPPARVRQSVQHAVAKRSRPVYARPTFRGMVATLGAAMAAAVVMLALRIPAGNQPSVIVATKPAAPAPAATAPAAPPTVERGSAVATTPAATTPTRSAPRPSAVGQMVAALADGVKGVGRMASRAGVAVMSTNGRDTGSVAAESGTGAATPAVVASAPIATPAPQPALDLTGPAAEPESETPAETMPRPHPVHEAALASAAPTVDSPLAEVRRVLRSDQRKEPATVRPKREPDRLATGPISPWGF